MVYPDPEFLGFKANDILTFFLRLDSDFFDPILSCKTFETNSLKLIFVLDVWFGCDCVCSNIEHLSNIDEIICQYPIMNYLTAVVRLPVQLIWAWRGSTTPSQLVSPVVKPQLTLQILL